MTLPCAAPAPCDTHHPATTTARLHPLVAVLLLAAAIRLPLAFWPNLHHPDEIFQYLEPAWRMLGHDGISSWEWRYGIRGWLLPTLMAIPVAIGDFLAPGGMGAFILPRLLAAIASLSIVASAFTFGARVSRTHALVAGWVAATWFELVYFAPHTLSEPLATAVLLPAAVLLTRTTPSRRDLIGGGALLALAFLLRFQYAPVIAALVLAACWRDRGRLVPLALGGAAILAVGAIADAAHGAVPFGWLVANVDQNLLHDRAAGFGTAPLSTYFVWLASMWSIAVLPLAFALVRGYCHAPVLVWMALVNILFHSLIGHKEYRFIFLSMALLVIVAAIGSADWIPRQGRSLSRRSMILLIAGWIGASAALSASGAMPKLWMDGIGAARLTAELKADPKLCGLALYDVPFFQLPGRDRLAGKTPLFALYPRDPLAGAQSSNVAKKVSTAFNRILADRAVAKDLPANFTVRDCDAVGSGQVCIFARDGDCNLGAAAPFALNDVLKRIDQ